MNIGSRRLTLKEEDHVLNIYEKLKLSFPNIRIDYREEIIGIGEEGRYLMCYFMLSDNALSVKFKNQTWLNINDHEAILSDIDKTVELFKNEELKLNKKRSSLKKEHFNDESNYIRDIFQLYTVAKDLISQNEINVSFDLCSTRLKNALYNSNVFTVKDLLNLTPEQIMNIPNLGRKGFRELCDFLTSVSSIESATQKNTSPLLIQAEEKLQKIRYIHDKNQKFIVDSKDVLLEFEEEIETYNNLYLELINQIYDSAIIKLNQRECNILFSRFGINEQAKTLQEIGEIHAISRERVRQLVNKAIRKISYKRITTEALLNLEYRKAKIISDIDTVSFGSFLSFLFLQEVSLALIKFICESYFRCDIDISNFKHTLYSEMSKKRQHDISLEKSRLYNDKINRLIVFPNVKRKITEEDFSRLKAERFVKSEDDELKYYTLGGKTYQCESFLEQGVLHKFLINNTFKNIKTQSLKIPIKDHFYHPDFQCLTHDNHLVLVEIKPLLNMCEYVNIEKFKVLKEYCEKYGFGYLIINERGDSFEHINEENSEFSESVLAEINQHGHIAYQKYKQIFSQTSASGRNLLTLVKNHKLNFSFPFLLKK